MTRVVHGVSSQGELFDVPTGLTLIEKSTFRRSLATRNLYSSGIFIFFSICHTVGDCKNDNFFIDSSQIYLLI